jgi:hypothetical protein
MKKFFALSMVLVGTLFFCACEKEMIQPDPQQEDVSALKKGANSKGMTKQNLTPFPMWARLASGAEWVIPATDEYGIIIFYVNDLSIIPTDWNFYPDNWIAEEFWLIPEEKWAVEGSSFHLPDNFAPHHYNMKGVDYYPCRGR